MFDRLKIKNRMLVGYSIPIVLLLGLSGIAYSIGTKVSTAIIKSNTAQTASIAINNATIGLSRADRAMRGYLITKDEKSRQSYETGIKNFQNAVSNAGNLIEEASQKARLKKIIKLGNSLNEFDRNIVSLVQQGKTAEAIKLFGTREGIKILREIEALTDEFNNKEVAILAASTNSAQSASNFLTLASGVGSLLAIAIALTAAYLISSSITRMIEQAARAVASSSTEIAATVEQQERTVSQQASSVTQTTTTMDELGASSRQSAEQAEASASGARQALNLAESGTKAMQRNMEEMSILKEKVGAIAEQILRLSEQTNQIGSVSGLVGDLANQTNMLALNAAVEAARAGEHGKGFGVVAGEIRLLADQSKKSAEKINALVTDIQAAINTTVMVTDEGTKKVDQGMQLTHSTAETFTSVADAINNVFLNSQQISLSAKQQAIAVQQVVDAMNSINMGAKESASGITQIRVSTKQLNDATQKLKAAV